MTIGKIGRNFLTRFLSNNIEILKNHKNRRLRLFWGLVFQIRIEFANSGKTLP